MPRTFRDYAIERDARLSADGQALLSQIDSAHRIGELVRTARTTRGISQTELSQATRVTQADISRIERAQIVPTLPTLLRLLDAMNCSLQVVLH